VHLLPFFVPFLDTHPVLLDLVWEQLP